MEPIARALSGPVARFIVRIVLYFIVMLYRASVIIMVPVAGVVVAWLASPCVAGYLVLHLVGGCAWLMNKVFGPPGLNFTRLPARAAQYKHAHTTEALPTSELATAASDLALKEQQTPLARHEVISAEVKEEKTEVIGDISCAGQQQDQKEALATQAAACGTQLAMYPEGEKEASIAPNKTSQEAATAQLAALLREADAELYKMDFAGRDQWWQVHAAALGVDVLERSAAYEDYCIKRKLAVICHNLKMQERMEC